MNWIVDVNIYVSQNDRFIQSLLTTIHGDEDKKFDSVDDLHLDLFRQWSIMGDF
jgi:hypothetical protein